MSNYDSISRVCQEQWIPGHEPIRSKPITQRTIQSWRLSKRVQSAATPFRTQKRGSPKLLVSNRSTNNKVLRLKKKKKKRKSNRTRVETEDDRTCCDTIPRPPSEKPPKHRRPASATEYSDRTYSSKESQEKFRNTAQSAGKPVTLRRIAIQSALLSFRHRIPRESFRAEEKRKDLKTTTETTVHSQLALEKTKLILDELLGSTSRSDCELENLLNTVHLDWDLSCAEDSDGKQSGSLFQSVYGHCEKSGILSTVLHPQGKDAALPDRLSTAIAFDMLEKLQDALPEHRSTFSLIRTILLPAVYSNQEGPTEGANQSSNNVSRKTKPICQVATEPCSPASDSAPATTTLNNNSCTSTNNEHVQQKSETEMNMQSIESREPEFTKSVQMEGTRAPVPHAETHKSRESRGCPHIPVKSNSDRGTKKDKSSTPRKTFAERFLKDEPYWERVATLRNDAWREREESKHLKNLLSETSEANPNDNAGLVRVKKHLSMQFGKLPDFVKQELLLEIVEQRVLPTENVFSEELVKKVYLGWLSQEKVQDAAQLRKEAKEAEKKLQRSNLPMFVRSAILRRRSLTKRGRLDVSSVATQMLAKSRGKGIKDPSATNVNSTEAHPAEMFLATSMRSLSLAQCARVMSMFMDEFGPEVIYTFVKDDPLLEEKLLIDCHPVNKLQTFWERNMPRLAQVLSLSPDLLKNLLFDHQGVGARMLEAYSHWLLGDGSGHADSADHRGVLRRLLLFFCREDPLFLRDAMLDDTLLIRSILESEGFDVETCRTIAKSSPKFFETVVKAGIEHLPWILSKDLALVRQLFDESPNFLNNFFATEPQQLAQVIRYNISLLARVLQADPTLVADAAASSSGDIYEILSRFRDLVLHILEHCDHDSLLHVLGSNPLLLTRNRRLLADLKMWSKVVFESEACHQGTQTDVIPVRPPAGTVAKALPELIGKKRIASARSSGQVLKLPELYAHIASVYQRKCTMDAIDDKAGHNRDPLPDTTHDYFMELHAENVLLVKKTLAKFVASLVSASEPKSNGEVVVEQGYRRFSTASVASIQERKMQSVNLRTKWFSIMNGVIESSSYSPKSGEVFLNLLCHLVPVDQIDRVVSRTFVFVDFRSVLDTTREILVALWSSDSVIQEAMEGLSLLRTKPMPRWKKEKSVEEEAVLVVQKSDGQNPGEDSCTNTTENKLLDNGREDSLSVEGERNLSDNEESENELEELDTLAFVFPPRAAKENNNGEAFDAQSTEEELVFVDLDEALDVVMNAWTVSDKAEMDKLVALFNESDTNGDGILDFGEFKDMVTKVDPNIDDRTVLRMFKLTGEETESGEKAITPDQFVSLMSSR